MAQTKLIKVGPIRETRFPELHYQKQDKDWRILGSDTGANVGPIYRSQVELLADLERYAKEYGCN